MIEAVSRGDLRGGSWRMRVARDHWDGDVRHVDEIAALRDVAIVRHPAYPTAAVELRSTREATVPDNRGRWRLRARNRPRPPDATGARG